MYIVKKVFGNTQKHFLVDGYFVESIAMHLDKEDALAVDEGGRKVVKAGTVYPANDATAIGLVLHDYDVTDGDANCAVVIRGAVLDGKVTVSATAKGALKGLVFVADGVVRENQPEGSGGDEGTGGDEGGGE